MSAEPRWPVQGERAYSAKDTQTGVARGPKPAGTVGDAEARLAYAAYARRYGSGQSFERLHERGGFGYWELTELLGREPTTWEAR